MDHNRYDYSPIIKRRPIQWPNGARVAVWVIPNIEYYEFEIPSVGHQPIGPNAAERATRFVSHSNCPFSFQPELSRSKRPRRVASLPTDTRDLP